MSDSKALKEQGNIAYNEDNFDEASKLFKQAIKVEESSMEKDANFLAILNSNLAQTYLEMKKYKEAVVCADLSLSYDPTFRKSIFRRAIANFELRRVSSAIVDLRHFLKLDSKNTEAIGFMRRITGPKPMSNLMRFAFVGHFLRRALSKFNEDPICNADFRKLLLRITFLSPEISCVSKYFWDDGNLGTFSVEGIASYEFRSWFVAKRVQCGSQSETFEISFSGMTLKHVFTVIKHDSVALLDEYKDVSSCTEVDKYAFIV